MIPFRLASALALAAIPAVAMAQFVPTAPTTSVQLYGRMDLSVNQVRTDGLVGSRTTVSSDTSLLGFRGVEDLGGGNLAYIKLEHGLAADTGLPASATFWNRETFVGLRSPTLGAIELGSFFSPFIWITGKTDPFARAMMGAQLALLQGSAVRGYAPTYPNSILYAAPKLGDVTVRLVGRLGEGTDNKNAAASIEYAKDRIYVGMAFDSVQVTATSVNSSRGGTVRARTVGLGATYRFDALRLFGYYQRNTAAGAAGASGYVVGLTVPAGSGEVRASVVGNRRSTGDATQAALGYWYPLSRRTALYGSVGNISNDGTAAFSLWPARQDAGAPAQAGGVDVRGMQVGMRHTF